MKTVGKLNYVFFAVFGVLLGLVVVKSLDLQTRWTVAMLAGLALCFLGACFSGHLERIAYACFILVLPLQLGKSFFYEPYAGGGHELRINLPEIIFLFVLLLYFANNIRRAPKLVFDRWTTVFCISFLLLSVLSLSNAANVTLGLFELIRASMAFLIFLFITTYLDNENKLRQTIILLLVGAVPQVAAGLYQFVFNKDIGGYLFGEMSLTPEMWAQEPMTRVGGLIGHPNAFATYLVMVLPFCLMFWSRRDSAMTKVLSFILFSAGVLALVCSQSRGAWIGFGLSFVAVFFVFLKRRGILSIRVWAVTGLVLLSLSLVTALSYDVLKKRVFLDDRGSASSRIPMMVDALNVIQDNPILGVGINNYALAVSRYDVTGIHREWQATTVHNLFLLVSAESGIAAGVVFAGFWLLILLRARKLSMSPKDDYFFMGLAFVMSLIGFLVIHQVDPNYRFYPSIQRLIWLIAGLVIAANRLSQRDQSSKGSSVI